MQLPYEKGVSPNSILFENTPSRRAKKTLFYLQRAGHFYCDTHYAVARESLHSFLLAVVLKGSLEVYCGGESVVAKANSAVLINCYLPHAYRALEPLEYIWIHFDGANTVSFYEEIFRENKSALCLSDTNHIQDRVLRILEQLHSLGKIEEIVASRRLHDLLCDLLYDTAEQEIEEPIIAAARRYMQEHLCEPLSVHALAKHCCISPSHFTRLFRKHTGQSPHEYCINLRIHKAKQLLKGTELSITEIAGAVGYEYGTSFTAAFRKKVGLSPRSFRNMPI